MATQTQQVIEVMEELGGLATLGKLNQKVDVSGWGTRTPYASIRRIVQDNRYFFKLKPGLWGLKEHKEKIENLLGAHQSTEVRLELDHYYYQGLLLEIGKAENHQTFIPDQDKNKQFIHTTLGQLRTLQRIHQFSYEQTVKRAGMIDVIWFNRRKMPSVAFEVEHSTDFTNALSKYIALQDFNMEFHVVASKDRSREFEEKISRDEYHPIKCRVKFTDYDELAGWHSSSMERARFKDMP